MSVKPSQPIRIAHVANSLTRASGVSYFCARLTQHLADAGCEVDLYVWWIGEDALLPESTGVRLHETRSKGLHFAARPDVIHIHSLWTKIGHQACVYARQHRIPYVISPHGMLSPWALRNRWWKKLLAMLAFQYRDLARSAALHATADTEIIDIRRLPLHQPILLAPLGTDMIVAGAEATSEAVNPSGPQQQSNGRRLALFLSRIHPVKGLTHLIDAWARVKNIGIGEGSDPRPTPLLDYDDWVLVIAGPDYEGHRDALIQRAALSGLRVAVLPDGAAPDVLSDPTRSDSRADIYFTGAVYGAAKTAWHQRASLFVLPSHSENFAGVVVDSLACGVPVITTHGTPWCALQGQRHQEEAQSVSHRHSWPAEPCGWWIPVGTEPLVNALREALSMDEERLIRMGRVGKDWVHETYAWPAIAEKVAQAYSALLKSPSIPPPQLKPTLG